MGNPLTQQSDEDSESDSSDDDLEQDLLAFDKEQADLIRNINKMGSMRQTGPLGENKFDQHSSMKFLSNSVSPYSKRRTQIDEKKLSSSDYEISMI